MTSCEYGQSSPWKFRCLQGNLNLNVIITHLVALSLQIKQTDAGIVFQLGVDPLLSAPLSVVLSFVSFVLFATSLVMFFLTAVVRRALGIDRFLAVRRLRLLGTSRRRFALFARDVLFRGIRTSVFIVLRKRYKFSKEQTRDSSFPHLPPVFFLPLPSPLLLILLFVVARPLLFQNVRDRLLDIAREIVHCWKTTSNKKTTVT